MRRRILLATLSVTLVGFVVLGLPLGLVARRVVHDDELRRLDREADGVGFAIEDDVEHRRPVDAARLARIAGTNRFVVVTDAQGRRTAAGRRPGGEVLTARVRIVDGVTIRVSASAAETNQRARRAVLLIGGLGLAGLAAAVVVAVVVSRRLSAPLLDLAGVSARLGAGDFSARSATYGVAEVDAVALAINWSAERIAHLIAAEREFAANASHQLRTPLTALRLRLEELAGADDEAIRQDAEAALMQADRLNTTITELLALARRVDGGHSGVVDVSALAASRTAGIAGQLAGAGRTVDVDCGSGCLAAASEAALGQALDAVLDNAVRHGAGAVHVGVRDGDEHVEVLIGDDGDGVAAADVERIFDRHVSLRGGTGVGLALARTLVAADGGRLELLQRTPPVFRILLRSSSHEAG